MNIRDIRILQGIEAHRGGDGPEWVRIPKRKATAIRAQADLGHIEISPRGWCRLTGLGRARLDLAEKHLAEAKRQVGWLGLPFVWTGIGRYLWPKAYRAIIEG